MKKDPRVYLAQILECIEKIESYIRPGKEAFLKDTMIQDAVIRNFEIIGEATKRVSDEYRRQHPDIPWKAMAAFRDVLIHDYERISSTKIWRIIETEISPVKTAILRALPPLDQLEREIAGDLE